jgi:hypothetical protein
MVNQHFLVAYRLSLDTKGPTRLSRQDFMANGAEAIHPSYRSKENKGGSGVAASFPQDPEHLPGRALEKQAGSSP